jgi:hypothetical protein
LLSLSALHMAARSSIGVWIDEPSQLRITLCRKTLGLM